MIFEMMKRKFTAVILIRNITLSCLLSILTSHKNLIYPKYLFTISYVTRTVLSLRDTSEKLKTKFLILINVTY